MKNDPSRPHGPAWRQQPGAGRRNPKAQQDWRQEPATPAAVSRVWSRKTKMWVGIGTLATLVAATVVVIALLRPANPSTWVLLGTHDWDNLDLPLNVEGYNGLVKFADWTHSDTRSFLWGWNLPRVLHDGPVELKKGTDWFAEVNEERKKEKTIVLYFAAPGGADADGPFLFYGDARPDDERKGRLYVTDILSRLEELPKDKNKVLILDATRNGASWPFGQLHNDFARRLIDLEERIRQIPRLIVINSSDAGQRSWLSDVARQTFFAYYLREGLRGDAAKGESVVRANMLFDYVKDKVERKVRATREAEQTPVLLPSKGGPELAKEIVLTRVTGTYHPPTDEPPKPNTAAIQKRWERCAELSRQSPPPYVNHPQLWRQYRAWCLRYEQLLRAGEEGGAHAIEAKLAGLESKSKLTAAIPDHAACLDNSLAMPTALGRAFPHDLDEQIQQGWRRLWRAEAPEEQQDAWKALQGMVKGPVPEKVLRLRCGTLLLGELADNADAPARAKAAAVLDLITANAGLRPAELHFLYMLLKNLHGDPGPKAVQMVCQTRRAAEEAALALPPTPAAGSYPYSEQVFPWIQARIDEADQARRQGEDLLFSSVPEQWQQAEGRLAEALKTYEEARTQGQEVARALAWRDRLFAILPDFSHWLAGRFLFPQATKETEDEVNNLQNLWVRAHRLDTLLAKPDPKAIPELAKLTGEVNIKFESLTREFNRRWKSLLDKRVTQPRWHEVEEILAASWADPDLLPDQNPAQRALLLDNHRSVSEDLLARSDSPDESVTAVKPDARLAASYQARLAVDALGERWIDQNRTGADPVYAVLMPRVASPDPERWQRDLALPSEQVGRLWRQLPKEIKKLSSAARGPDATLKVADQDLTQADQLCRLLDGPAVDRIVDDPAADARRLQWHNLFIALGRRTAADQWYGPDSQVYYRVAGGKYREEAAKLVSALAGKGGPPKGLLAAATALQQELDQNSKLDLTGPEQVSITSQSQFVVDCRLVGHDGLKPGFAILGMKAGKAFAPEFERDTRERRARRIDPKAGGLDLKYILNKAEASTDEDKDREIVVEAFYRGQQPRRVITGQVYAPDTIITFTPRPKEASLAVLSDPAVEEQFAPKNSVLTIVLDCSGSMWTGLNPPPDFAGSAAGVRKAAADWNAGKWQGQKRRFDKAVDSLEKVLRDLKPGITVNLWTFAQLEQDGAIRKLWGPEKWNSSKLDNLMQQVRGQVPCYETPLVQAMSRAKGDFDPNSGGFKTLVVLTDGMDNKFFTNECAALRQKYNIPNITIPKFLHRDFQDSGIRVHMALFDVEKNELDNAKKQFSELGKFDPPGEVKVINNAEELVKDLRRVMRFELRYWLYRDGEKSVAENGFPVTYIGRNLFWPQLAPAMYTIRVNNKYPQDVQLNDGDLVIATLRRQGKAIYLDRGLYARDLVKRDLGNVDNNETKKVGDWWLSLLQNERGTNALQLLMCLEKESPATALIGRHAIRQVRPQFVWFEIQGKGVPNPKLSWGNQEYFPAPAWSLEIRDWTANADGVLPQPVASVWWSDGWDPVRLDTLPRHPEVEVNQDFTTQVGKDIHRKGYLIKRVAVEEHPINDQVGKKPCLVVRVQYADPKSPVLVRLKRLPGVTDQQAQHCYYSKTNEYTGYFWPVSAADLERDFDLEVISLGEFKQKAEDRHTFIKNWPLPSLGNRRPLPITLKPQGEGDD